MKTKILLLFLLISIAGAIPCMAKKAKVKDVMDIIYQVNDYWQSTHPRHGRAFWDNAAYHTGNMEAYFLTQKTEYMNYSLAWAEHNGKEQNLTIKANGHLPMEKRMSMYCLVTGRSVFRHMRICIRFSRNLKE